MRAFELLRDFASGLGGSSLVGEVLPRVGTIIAAAAGVSPSPERKVLAYSVLPEIAELLCVAMDGGEAKWLTLARAGPASGRAGSPQSAMAAAGRLLRRGEELLEWIDAGSYIHRAVVCEGRWIGGVFLPSDNGGGCAVSEELQQAVAAGAGLALAMVQGRARAVLLGEQLAEAREILDQTQEALTEARALAAVVEMAAGAAHELNNPLAIVSGRAQLMAAKAAGEEDRKVWSLISQQAQRMSDIISDLMSFASPPPPQPGEIDPAELLSQAAERLRSSDEAQVRSSKVDITVSQGAASLWADREQVLGVLGELMHNAARACDGRQAAIHLSADQGPEDGWVTLSVADEGEGMDEATLAKAFTPFFSARRAGRRRGLGLARARRTVEANGGRIFLRSKAGEGTTATVQLPSGQ